MKVAIVATFLGQKTSGAEISAYLLAKNLKDTFVVTTKITKPMPFKCYDIPFTRHIPNLMLLIGSGLIDFFASRRIRRIFESEKPDIVHVQDSSLMAATLKAVKAYNVPVIFTVRDYRFANNLSIPLEDNKIVLRYTAFEYFKWLYASFKQAFGVGLLSVPLFPWFYSQNNRLVKFFKKFDAYIAVSDYVRAEVIRSGVPAGKVKTIKVQMGEWKPNLSLTVPYRVFSAGGLKGTKGFDYLIRSFRLVANDLSRAKLYIAGDGSARKKLENLSASLNLQGNVFFLGQIDHDKMREEYMKSSVVVSPSLWPEPLSRIIFEAFTMKKPVVGTNVGGTCELVIEGKTGHLVKPKDTSAMSRAILHLLKNPDVAKSMGKCGFDSIVNECSASATASKHDELYHNLLD